MILIRADANEKIGLGHVMRCLSIAHALKEKGETVKMICADDSAEEIIRQHGLELICLQTDYSDMESELEALIPITDEAAVILIDSYYVTASYFEQLRRHIRIAYIDDLNEQSDEEFQGIYLLELCPDIADYPDI